MNNTIANSLYAQSNGITSSSPFVDVFLPRNPTSNDIGPPYQTQKKWFNTETGQYWILQGFTSSGGLQAEWSQITGIGGNAVRSIQGNSGGEVYPTTGGNLLLQGSGGVLVSGTPLSNLLTISVTDQGIVWDNIIASQTLSVNSGYFCNSPGGSLTLLLPSTSNVGDVIYISLDGATSWSITQNSGQQIRLGPYTTTMTSGSLVSQSQGDTVYMVCSVANTRWNCISVQGNIIIN